VVVHKSGYLIIKNGRPGCKKSEKMKMHKVVNLNYSNFYYS